MLKPNDDASQIAALYKIIRARLGLYATLGIGGAFISQGLRENGVPLVFSALLALIAAWCLSIAMLDSVRFARDNRRLERWKYARQAIDWSQLPVYAKARRKLGW